MSKIYHESFEFPLREHRFQGTHELSKYGHHP